MNSADCPICGKELWFYDCYQFCPDCILEIPCAIEDKIEVAKSPDGWGLYAFYDSLPELVGLAVIPAANDPSPNFTAQEDVIITDVYPPNSVRIGYREGGSIGLRGLSELRLKP